MGQRGDRHRRSGRSRGGAFAGPVIAAAVILIQDTIIEGLAYSKLLGPERREKLFALISAGAVEIGIGRTDVEEVDRLKQLALWETSDKSETN